MCLMCLQLPLDTTTIVQCVKEKVGVVTDPVNITVLQTIGLSRNNESLCSADTPTTYFVEVLECIENVIAK